MHHTTFALAAGKVSDSVVSLKKEVVGFLSQHMAASNLANDEGTLCANSLECIDITRTSYMLPMVSIDDQTIVNMLSSFYLTVYYF